MSRHGYRLLELTTEDITQPDSGTNPEKCPCAVIQEILLQSETDNACKRRSDRAESRDKFGDNQGTRPVTGKEFLGSPHARNRFERDLAAPVQDTAAATSPELVPHLIAQQGGNDRCSDRQT